MILDLCLVRFSSNFVLFVLRENCLSCDCCFIQNTPLRSVFLSMSRNVRGRIVVKSALLPVGSDWVVPPRISLVPLRSVLSFIREVFDPQQGLSWFKNQNKEKTCPYGIPAISPSMWSLFSLLNIGFWNISFIHVTRRYYRTLRVTAIVRRRESCIVCVFGEKSGLGEGGRTAVPWSVGACRMDVLMQYRSADFVR